MHFMIEIIGMYLSLKYKLSIADGFFVSHAFMVFDPVVYLSQSME